MEIAVAAISAAIALAALVVSIRVAHRQTRIQERMAAIEEVRWAQEVDARARAQMTASVQPDEREDRAGDNQLVLRNEGPAVAHAVRATVEEGPRIPPVFGLEILPVNLQPGQEMRFTVAPTMGDRGRLRVTVCWTDAAGEHQEPYTLQAF
jgi:hypothetical protein